MGTAHVAVKKELFSLFGDTVSVQTFSGESKQGVDEARAGVHGRLRCGHLQHKDQVRYNYDAQTLLLIHANRP
jgi:hypothetical protein